MTNTPKHGSEDRCGARDLRGIAAKGLGRGEKSGLPDTGVSDEINHLCLKRQLD